MNTFLTPEQVFELNEKFGWFQYGDAQSDVSKAFAQAAIEKHERIRAAAPDLLLAAQEAMRLVELLEVLAGSHADIYKHELRGDAELFRSRIAPAIEKAIGDAA